MIHENDEMDCLGALLHATGTTQLCIQHRLHKATAAFWANHELLTAPHVPIPVRLKEYVSRVQSVALYSASTWTWNKTTSDALFAWESALLGP